MTPYYSEDGITIYNADCREVLPTLAKVDLVLTDPPYGVSGHQNAKPKGTPRKNNYSQFIDSAEYIKTVAVPAFVSAMRLSKRAILTPGNRWLTLYPPPDSFGCFYQPASVGLQPWGRADAQPIFYYGAFPHNSNRIVGSRRRGLHGLAVAEGLHGSPRVTFLLRRGDRGQVESVSPRLAPTTTGER